MTAKAVDLMGNVAFFNEVMASLNVYNAEVAAVANYCSLPGNILAWNLSDAWTFNKV